MAKHSLRFSVLAAAALVVSACGSSDDSTDVEENVAEEEIVDEENDPEEPEEIEEVDLEEEDEADSEEDETSNSGEFDEMIAYMEETTEGTANVLFENNEQQIHETEGFTVSLDGYTLVELNDFHTNYRIPFDDQTDGGVILAHYTVTNDTGDDAYFMPALSLMYTGATKYFNNYRELLPEEEQLDVQLAHSTDYAIADGETITGYFTYPFGQDQLEEVLAESTAMIDVPAPHSELGDVNSNFGDEGSFTVSLNEDGAERAEHNEAFYPDLVTANDMGDKEMIAESDGINDSQELGNTTITLDGYQFTEFTPNDVEAPRFENFTNGIVLLTVQFGIDNQEDSEIALSSIMSSLLVNDGAQSLLNEGMLLDYRYDDVIESGESGELLQLYTLDQEQYEKIWKDKSFEVEIGPMRDQESTDLSKGNRVTFELPTE
ncbi:DUF5068 domain-containing protein [Geomicrobium sp. JCM 19038]|uniref:DUF5068 domain-containing protein n=1 Tax=Geomicrobium sp. JCM 19038 TaxID=1460635 RepID=UPI00045F3D8E|nr:DUF5068 domain-containing protein [Geomicrobium sp. JCM 19038]GAK06828.1 hypothetical protein JCM19038_537 [Geomicrobium sp. JCM 19038]